MLKRRQFDFWSYVAGADWVGKEIQRMMMEDNLPQCRYCSSKSVAKYGTFKEAQLDNARFSWIVVDT